jgi:hypothetical protein
VSRHVITPRWEDEGQSWGAAIVVHRQDVRDGSTRPTATCCWLTTPPTDC